MGTNWDSIPEVETEALQFENHSEEEDCPLGAIRIGGRLHHVQAIRVHDTEDTDGGTVQEAVKDPFNRYEVLCSCDEDVAGFQTVKIPGFEGEYVLLISGYER